MADAPLTLPATPALSDEQIGAICDQFKTLIRQKREVHIRRGLDAGADYYIGDVANYVGHAVKEAANARIAELVAENEMLSRSLDESLFCNVQGIAERLAESPQPPAAPLTPPAVETALRDAISVISSINGGHANRVMKNGEAVYWQRKEWIDWARLEVLPTIQAALDGLTRATPEATPDWYKLEMLKAAAQSGNPAVIAFAAQLAGVPPCDACGYVKAHCRCAALTQAADAGAAEPVAWLSLDSVGDPDAALYTAQQLQQAVARAVEDAAQRVEALIADHVAGTQKSPHPEDHCRADDQSCEYVVAWRDAVAAIRQQGTP